VRLTLRRRSPSSSEVVPAAASPRRRTRSLRGGLTLRVRLALLSSLLSGLTLVAFSLFVYFTQLRALTEEVDRALADRAEVIAAAIMVGGTPTFPTVTLPDADALAVTGTLVQVVDARTADVKAQSELLSRYGLALPISTEAEQAARSGNGRFERIVLAGVPLRLYSRPLILGGRLIGLLQVARPVGPTEDALTTLQLVLAGGIVASIFLSALLGLFVARAALSPIDRLTREAEQIGRSQDFGRRVTSKGSDEVGRLASTFNEMLGQLQSSYATLQTVNDRLAATLESQRRFVADASHELRTPLTTVRGNASLLNRFETLTTEDRQAVVDQIAAESDRMARLVSDLLTLARADAGQSLRHEPVALGPLLQDVARQARGLAAGKVAVSVVFLADATVTGDPDALRQLLLILVDNAIKYTPEGGSVTLGLRLDSGSGGERCVRVTVVDTGIGIGPEDLPHIFDRFYRADRARGAGGGTGLGLAIGKWIVEAHGGSIEAESEIGSGSIMTVTLPAATATLVAPRTSDENDPPEPASQKRAPGSEWPATALTDALTPG
jgi:two-component system, OmpR family, sensor kinase